MTAYVGVNHSPRNTRFKNVTWGEAIELAVWDKDVTDPSITLPGEIDTHINYLYIPEYGRYYFINGIRDIRKGVYEIIAHVDVISSFNIDYVWGIAERSQNGYNLYINDNQFIAQQNPRIQTKAFPSGFANNIEFVLAVAGEQSGGT